MKSRCYLCEAKHTKIVCYKNNYEIVKCNLCNFVFVKYPPSITELSKWYERLDYRTPILSEPRIRADAKRSLSIILKYTNKKKILDIGCGRGYLLDEARKIGLEPSGIDNSEKAVSYACNILKLNVIKGDINRIPLKSKYDIIILNQVIEHLVNPVLVIKKITTKLNKNGLLYIATPNYSSFLSRIYKNDYEYLDPPEHLGYYSVIHLENLLKKNSLIIKYKGSWSYSENFIGILKKIIKNKKSDKQKVKHENMNVNNDSGRYKKINYYLFDKIIAKLFYRVLNINYSGTNIEIIGQNI